MNEQVDKYCEHEDLITEVQSLIDEVAEDIEPQGEQVHINVESVKLKPHVEAKLSKVALNPFRISAPLMYGVGSGLGASIRDHSAQDTRQQVQLNRGPIYFKLNPDTQMYEKIEKK